MARMIITVEFNDGSTKEVNVPPVSQVAFEREHKIPLASLADEPYLMHSYWLAWHASQAGRNGKLSFDDWLDTVAGLVGNVEDAEGDADPLAATVPSGASLLPPSNQAPESPSPS